MRDDAAVLKLNVGPETKCCYEIDNGDGLEKHLTGFARILTYEDSTSNGKNPNFLEMLYEGQLTLGQPSGFGRKIDGRSKMHFVGYFRGWNDTKQAPTLGIYF